MLVFSMLDLPIDKLVISLWKLTINQTQIRKLILKTLLYSDVIGCPLYIKTVLKSECNIIAQQAAMMTRYETDYSTTLFR